MKGEVTILHNNFENNYIDISPCGSDPIISYNVLMGEISIELNRQFEYTGSFAYCMPEINNNNFHSSNFYITLHGEHSLNGDGYQSYPGMNVDLIANLNYWADENVELKIYDNNDTSNPEFENIIFTPSLDLPVIDAGIIR